MNRKNMSRANMNRKNMNMNNMNRDIAYAMIMMIDDMIL